ncbi:MAG: energy-coupling factor transporter ATPase [Oscillospiraceae bacterium]|nr:energy-coupling factor transporter ATPase [Oscillospiraceae bacterium]
MATIRTENLNYTYGIGTPFEKTAINNINIEIKPGSLVGIIGHTGSGKSTLIQHFNGLLKPTSGKIYIDDVDIWENKKNIRDVRFKVGLVFQYPEYQIFEDSVFRDVAFGPKNMGLDEEQIKQRVTNALESVGLPLSYLDRSPFELSGGEKRRVAIAGVMAMQPEVLILDEPTAGLDPRGRDTVFSLIKDYHKKTQCTVLLVSHSMEDIAKYADTLLVMNNSEVFCYDKTVSVFEKSEEIQQMGLDVPQITRVFNELKKRGVNIGEEIYTVNYAKKLVLEYLGKAGEKSC